MFYNIPGTNSLLRIWRPCRIMTAMMECRGETFDTTIPQLSTPGVLKLKDRAVK